MRTAVLSDIIELIGGGTPKTSKPEFWNGDIPWLSVVDFGGDGRWVDKAEKTITNLGLENSSTKLLKSGDIVISARGTVGELAQLKRPMAFNQSCYGIRARTGVDQDFLYYLLKKSVNDLRRQSHGGVFNTITRSTFDVVSVNIPSIVTQKKIADILSSLDEKIELNHRMNKTLEQLGQALFRHYFVDNPEAKNWDEGTLGDIMNITMGQSPPGKSYNNNGDGVVFYQGRADFGLRYPNMRLFTTDPKRFAEVGDVLLTVRAPVGDVNQASERCCIGRGLAAISSRTGAVSFCYYYCHQLKADFLEYNSEGTVFGSINSKQLKTLKLKIPPIGLVEKFENEVAVIDKTIMLNSYQVKTLVVLRDSLLPKLISGGIEV